MKFRNFLSVCLCVLFLSACPKTLRPTLPQGGVELPPSEIQPIVEGLRRRQEALRSYRGLAKAVIKVGDEESRLRYAIAMKRPEAFRLEALPAATVYTLSLLVAKGGKIIYLDAVDKWAMTSASGDAAVKKMLQLPLSDRELMAYVNGLLPDGVIEELGAGSLRVQRAEGGKQQVLLSRPGGDRYWLIDAQTYELRSVQARDKFRNLALFDLALSDYVDVEGIRLPGVLRAQIPQSNAAVELQFVIQKTNLELPEGLFEARVPAGYERR